jgi:hypothetical protein
MHIPRFTTKRMMAWTLAAAIACYLMFEPFPPTNDLLNYLIGVTLSVAFCFGAASHPWVFLAIGLFLWNCVPLIDHGENALSLSVRGSFLGWLIGAPAGWFARNRPKKG